MDVKYITFFARDLLSNINQYTTGHKGIFWVVEIIHIFTLVMVSFVKTNQTIELKCVNFIVFKLYLNKFE